jgi:hypothetical protein
VAESPVSSSIHLYLANPHQICGADDLQSQLDSVSDNGEWARLSDCTTIFIHSWSTLVSTDHKLGTSFFGPNNVLALENLMGTRARVQGAFVEDLEATRRRRVNDTATPRLCASVPRRCRVNARHCRVGARQYASFLPDPPEWVGSCNGFGIEPVAPLKCGSQDIFIFIYRTRISRIRSAFQPTEQF